jgi:hypothetical protein
MAWKSWLFAFLAIMTLGIGAIIGRWFVTPTPGITVQFKENSCIIHCPDGTAHAGSEGSVTCAAGTSPICQCNDPARALAGCVAVN